jgi:chromosome segregation ATPase
VVLSLLNSAAIVVYVNKEDITKQSLDDTRKQRDAARAESAALQQQLAAAQLNLTTVQDQANANASAASAENTRLQREISRLNVDLAQASGAAAAQQLDISRLTEALNASQTSSGKLSEEVNRLRGGNDTLVRQSAELNATVSDLTNKLDVTERDRRLLAEQLTQMRASAEQMQKTIQGAGLTPQQATAAANRSGQPSINGVVRDVRTINGRQYATISVGAADGVAQGLEFKVVERGTMNFLGTLTVNSVYPNEATGVLVGPNVAAIKPGVEVRTQL